MINIKSNIKDIIKKVEKTQYEVKKMTTIEDIAKDFESEVKRNARLKFKKPTGNLENSITRTGDASHQTITADSVYGMIQDRGGIIRPVNGKYLTIPTRKGLQPARSYTDLFKPRNKNILMRKSNKEVLFILAKYVTLKPTYWWSEAINNLTNRLEKLKTEFSGIILRGN